MSSAVINARRSGKSPLVSLYRPIGSAAIVAAMLFTAKRPNGR